MRDNYGDLIWVHASPAENVIVTFTRGDYHDMVDMSLTPEGAKSLVKKINKAIKEIEHG